MNYKPFEGEITVKNKVTLITGAANGIGKSTSYVFAKSGAKIVLIDIDEKIEKMAEDISNANGVETLAIVCDLTEKRVYEKIVSKTMAHFGCIDILANIAGIGLVDYAISLQEEMWDKTMLLNVKVPFMLSQAVGKVMIEQKWGRIVCVASQGGVIATERHVAYTASKAALIGMAKTLALEWAQYNINVNIVSPTVVLTEMSERIWQGEAAKEMRKKYHAGDLPIPMRYQQRCYFYVVMRQI